MTIARRLVPVAALALGASLLASSDANWTAPLSAQGPATRTYEERDFLSRIRRLTVEGRRAGEGYWSADGRRLVFQSERDPANPFYQIFVLDLDTGDVERISPGMGKTTCAFFHPDGRRILFSSTHLDPRSKQLQDEELAFRASGRQRRYAWDYDTAMDIFVHTEGSSDLTRLTDTVGYDAEGNYSPDGQWVVFASTRDAYSRTLSAAEQKQLETDPSYFAEIYIMRADGSGQRRLTTTAGYDGGPFFTADGQRIVWRRFDEMGLIADIWTMNLDGSDPKQITDFGAMSWAPYQHPSGEYFLFASNKLGFENFEVFIVDSEGTKEPVRVTYSPGFDGLPVPSPDGQRVAWSSTRSGGDGGQLFLAEWNHAKALEAIEAAPPRASRTQSTGTADLQIREHVTTLAGDSLEGRLSGSVGEARAADYIVGELEEIGAMPLPGQQDFRIPFSFTAGSRDGGSSITIAGRTFEGTDTVQALSFSDTGSVTGDVVFAGYGIVVPESQNFGYDSYRDLDVKDKVVVVLRYFPEDADQQSRGILARYAGLRFKAMAARQRGARAIIVVTGPRSPNAGLTVPMTFDTALAGSGIVAASVNSEVAQALWRGRAQSLEETQRALDTGNPHITGFALEGVTASLETEVVRETRTGYNVAGYLPATGAPLREAWLALGAHYDHLGRGDHGNSLATATDARSVHAGADDNASGTAAVLEIGRLLAGQARKRHVILGFWSGEEIGLLGSAAFVNESPMPIDQLMAYLNFDMVGRMADNKLTLQATGTSPQWARLIEQANVAAGFELFLQSDPYLPTDSASFNQADVPTLNFFTGIHTDYHKPSDTAEKINYEDLDRIVRFGTQIARRAAALDAPLEFVKVEQRIDSTGGSREGMRVFTGTIPDYATDVKGLLLSGVIGGGPAERAGLQKGDVIVEIAGQTIANVYDYTYALEVLRIGEPTTVIFMRGTERRETSLTPEARR